MYFPLKYSNISKWRCCKYTPERKSIIIFVQLPPTPQNYQVALKIWTLIWLVNYQYFCSKPIYIDIFLFPFPSKKDDIFFHWKCARANIKTVNHTTYVSVWFGLSIKDHKSIFFLTRQFKHVLCCIQYMRYTYITVKIIPIYFFLKPHKNQWTDVIIIS